MRSFLCKGWIFSYSLFAVLVGRRVQTELFPLLRVSNHTIPWQGVLRHNAFQLLGCTLHFPVSHMTSLFLESIEESASFRTFFRIQVIVTSRPCWFGVTNVTDSTSVSIKWSMSCQPHVKPLPVDFTSKRMGGRPCPLGLPRLHKGRWGYTFFKHESTHAPIQCNFKRLPLRNPLNHTGPCALLACRNQSFFLNLSNTEILCRVVTHHAKLCEMI